jgi:hypothetical protein
MPIPYFNRSYMALHPGANVTIDIVESTGEDVWDVTINATAGGVAGVDIEDDGTPVASATTLDFGTNLTVTDNGGGNLTVDGSGGGVTDADYLVGTSHAGLSAEIVVGTTPGGELGGTWASPTVDATHSGSAHVALTANTPQAVGTAAVGNGTASARDNHVHATGAGTPSTQALGDSAETGTGPAAAMTNHKHAMPTAAVTTSGLTQTTARILGRTTSSTGAIEEITVGTGLSLAAGSLTATGGSGAVATDTIWDAKGDLAGGTGADTAAKLTVGANDTILMADSGETTGLKWVASATPSTQALGDAAAAGTADTFTRGDHKHAIPTAASVASSLAGITGGLAVVTAVTGSDVTHAQSDTNLSNITGLTFTIGASSTEVWQVMALLEMSATTNAVDMKFGWTVPASATMRWGHINSTSAGYYSAATTTGTVMVDQTGIVASGTVSGVLGEMLAGKVYGGGTGGAVQLQFAQNTSSATDLIALKGSTLLAWKVAS